MARRTWVPPPPRDESEFINADRKALVAASGKIPTFGGSQSLWLRARPTRRLTVARNVASTAGRTPSAQA
jgi:hypothetical protein